MCFSEDFELVGLGLGDIFYALDLLFVLWNVLLQVLYDLLYNKILVL